jgi:hypothetical protein
MLADVIHRPHGSSILHFVHYFTQVCPSGFAIAISSNDVSSRRRHSVPADCVADASNVGLKRPKADSSPSISRHNSFSVFHHSHLFGLNLRASLVRVDYLGSAERSLRVSAERLTTDHATPGGVKPGSLSRLCSGRAAKCLRGCYDCVICLAARRCDGTPQTDTWTAQRGMHMLSADQPRVHPALA